MHTNVPGASAQVQAGAHAGARGPQPAAFEIGGPDPPSGAPHGGNRDLHGAHTEAAGSRAKALHLAPPFKEKLLVPVS